MNQLNPAQADQLREIGAYLRQLRQQQSISTEEVAAKTFIPSRLLKALEEGQSEQLPEPVFIQGFIRRYAEALNQDGATLAKRFAISLLPVKSNTSSPEFSKRLSQNNLTGFSEKIDPKWRIYLEMPSIDLSPSLQPYLLYVLLVVGAASGLVHTVNKPQTARLQVQKEKTPVVQPKKTIAKPAPSTPASLRASQPSSPIQVNVSLKEESWLRVKVDGKTEFEGILTKGEQQSWIAKKQLSIRAGNAGAVSVSLNKQEAKVLGKMGDVKEIAFTPDT